MSNKVTLTILPQQQTYTVDSGITLADALTECGIMMHTPCGGKGICKRCTIKATGLLSEPDEYEIALGDSSLRLACRAIIKGNVTVWADSISEYIHYPLIDSAHTYGVAVDIGTTTLQIVFVDLTTGKVQPEITLLNPQRRFGHDVISRISNASNPKIAHKLTQLLIDTIISLIATTCRLSQTDFNNIQAIAISGNTVMTYSFLGIDITPLGTFPYNTPITTFNEYSNYHPLKNLFPKSTIYVLPVVSAFLGGDFLGGFATIHAKGYNSFFFDIGTNGEMAIIKSDGSIIATSCAMGPALEGMNISSGMTATQGAITHFTLHNSTLTYTSLGKPIGLSGTALVDIIAILLQVGIVDSSGVITNAIPESFKDQVRLEYNNGIKTLKICNDITLTQIDIRNIQLAKAASLAASRILLNKAGLTEHDINTVYIAGAFGKNVDINNFTRLSFIPNFKSAHYNAVGNTSLQAAIEAITNPAFKKDLLNIRNNITTIDLSSHSYFNDEYIKSLDF